jgi:hypothetical protein
LNIFSFNELEGNASNYTTYIKQKKNYLALYGMNILNRGTWMIIYRAFTTPHKNYIDADLDVIIMQTH